MKTLILISLSVLIFQTSFTQQKVEAYFGEPGRTDASKEVLELYDNGYYIAGGFEGTGDFHFGWGIKTDVNLEILYDKVFGHSSGTIGNFRATSDENGNIYIAGSWLATGHWPFVTKIDSCGNKVWCKVLQLEDEFEDGYSTDILITGKNEIVVLASYDSDEEINKLHLISLTQNGEVLWIKPFASKNDHPWIKEPNGHSLVEINNNFYISGYCYWPYPDDTTHVFIRPLFIGIDSLFNEKWILPFYAMDSVFGEAFTTFAINDSIFIGTGFRRIDNNTAHSLLMLYDKNGKELGYHEIENEQIGNNVEFNLFSDIERINDSLFLAAAYLGSEELGNPHSEFIIDTSCNLYNFSIRNNTTGWAHLIKTFDDKYVVATGIEETKGDNDIYVYKIDENLNDVPFDPTPHNYDSLCPGGIASGNIDLTYCLVWTDIGDAPSPKEYYESIRTIPVKVYPNPVKGGEVTFGFENTEHHRNMELRCFDIFGGEVFKEKIYRHQGNSVINVSRWPQGMYVAVVYSDGLPAGQCKFVVQ